MSHLIQLTLLAHAQGTPKPEQEVLGSSGSHFLRAVGGVEEATKLRQKFYVLRGKSAKLLSKPGHWKQPEVVVHSCSPSLEEDRKPKSSLLHWELNSSYKKVHLKIKQAQSCPSGV